MLGDQALRCKTISVCQFLIEDAVILVSVYEDESRNFNLAGTNIGIVHHFKNLIIKCKMMGTNMKAGTAQRYLQEKYR